MLKKILSISGRPGLFRLVNQGKNSLIVESLQTGKRTQAYVRDKVVSLGDIAMFTYNDEIPLSQVLETLKEKNDGKPVDVKAFADDAAFRAYFETILPDFDQDRVYTSGIKKLYNWYNQLIAAGITDFKDEEIAQDQAAEAAEAADGTEVTPPTEEQPN